MTTYVPCDHRPVVNLSKYWSEDGHQPKANQGEHGITTVKII